MKLLTSGRTLSSRALRVTIPDQVQRQIERMAREEFADERPYVRSFVIKHVGRSKGWLVRAGEKLRQAVMEWAQPLIEQYPRLIERSQQRRGRIYFVRYRPDSQNGHGGMEPAGEEILGFVVHQFTAYVDPASLGLDSADQTSRPVLAVIATGYFPPRPPLHADGLRWAGSEGQAFVRAQGDIVSTNEYIGDMRVRRPGSEDEAEVIAIESIRELTSITVAPDTQDREPGFPLARAIDEQDLGEGIAAQHFSFDALAQENNAETGISSRQEDVMSEPNKTPEITIERVEAWAVRPENREAFIKMMAQYVDDHIVPISTLYPDALKDIEVEKDDKGGLQLVYDKRGSRDKKLSKEFTERINREFESGIEERNQRIAELEKSAKDLQSQRDALLINSFNTIVEDWKGSLGLADQGEVYMVARKIEEFREELKASTDPAQAFEKFKERVQGDLDMFREARRQIGAPPQTEQRQQFPGGFPAFGATGAQQNAQFAGQAPPPDHRIDQRSGSGQSTGAQTSPGSGLGTFEI